VFTLLNKLAGIVGPAEASLGKTMETLAEVIGKLRLTAGSFASANAKNAGESLAGLLFGNVATVELGGAVAGKALEIKQVTGLITNSRLVKAGTSGFLALAPSARVALQVADAASLYGTIAAWGASEFINVADIEQTAGIANQLGNSVSRVVAVLNAAKTRYSNADQFIGTISGIRDRYNGAVFGRGDSATCASLTKELEGLIPVAQQAATSDQVWTNGVDALAGQLGSALAGLVHPS
jgi:hypothetical protein